MGSKPKPQEYKPSETEKQQAAQAQADQAFFESHMILCYAKCVMSR